MEGEQNKADTNPYAVKTCICLENHLVFLKGLLKKLKFFKMKLVFNIFSDQKEREGMFKKHALAEAGGRPARPQGFGRAERTRST
ncbi:MAG: hypothetical protein ACE1ZW_07365 [Nitrospirales bacterium]